MPPTKDPKQRPLPQTARQDTASQIHPSRGGARGYDLAVRQAALAIRLNGAKDEPVFDALRAQLLHPSKATTSRWAARLAQEGNFFPYEMNGNNPAEALRGRILLMLATYSKCYEIARSCFSAVEILI
jgi:hypothetical protein